MNRLAIIAKFVELAERLIVGIKQGVKRKRLVVGLCKALADENVDLHGFSNSDLDELIDIVVSVVINRDRLSGDVEVIENGSKE